MEEFVEVGVSNSLVRPKAKISATRDFEVLSPLLLEELEGLLFSSPSGYLI